MFLLNTYPVILRATLALALLCTAFGASALEGFGYGVDADEARRRAAADLAAAINVRVKSVVERCTQVSNQKPEDCGSRVLNLTATDLPLLGLAYRELPGGNEPAGAKAELLTEKSGPLYREKLTSLSQEFAAGQQALSGAKDRKARHDLLLRQLMQLRALADHRLVAVALLVPMAETLTDKTASETALTSELAGLEDTADSLAFAARVLLKDVRGRLPEVSPFHVSGSSQEVTPLGGALADALRVEMSGEAGKRGGPRLRAAGEYRLLDNGDVIVLVDLRDDFTGSLVATRSVRLAKAAYEGLRAQPLAPDFEKLLRDGEAISGDLRADLVTSVGNRNLKFKSGDTLKLVARLNRAGYFYVVGHIVRPDVQLSYLLPLQDNPQSKAAFTRYVPADQVNHYLELGEFSVEPPFGVEHLQIIASTKPLIDNLPAVQYDKVSGYYVIQGSQGNATKGLLGTRGLKPKPSAKAMVAEGTLSFTTTE
jgi:hypothetical protein